MTTACGHIKDSAGLLAIARAVAERSADRYRDLASAFDVACNPETAAIFRTLAEEAEARAASVPEVTPVPASALNWFDSAPEIADPDSVHFLMLPWHALDLAWHTEERLRLYYAGVAAESRDSRVRAVAADLVRRTQDRQATWAERRDALPKPAAGWWVDEDGPNLDAE